MNGAFFLWKLLIEVMNISSRSFLWYNFRSCFSIYFRDLLMVADIGWKPSGSFIPCLYYSRCGMGKCKKYPIFFPTPRYRKYLTASEFFRKAAILDQTDKQQRYQTSIFHSRLHAYLLWGPLVPWSMSWQYVTFSPSFQKASSNGNNLKQDFHFAFYSLHSHSRAIFRLIATQTRTNSMYFCQ